MKLKLFSLKKREQTTEEEKGVMVMEEPGLSLEMVEKPNLIPVTAAEIHEEFDKAAEEMLEEAKAILSKACAEDDTEILKLKELGFSNLKLKQDTISSIEQREKTRNDLKLIEYYKRTYPNNLFLTKDKIKTMCQKYGLIIGSAWDYIGEIPKKNRKEIINFQVLPNDLNYTLTDVYYRDQEISYQEYLRIREEVEGDKNKYIHINTNIKIIATPNLFNLENKVISDYEIKDVDPIVIYPVRGGYLMVSKWGAEANIEGI